MPELSDSELHRDVKELTVQIARVVRQLELWTPILDRQTAGMVNQENRISRVEDRAEALVKQRDEDRQRYERQRDEDRQAYIKQRDEDRQADRQEFDDRLKILTICFSVAGLGLTLLGHFWK